MTDPMMENCPKHPEGGLRHEYRYCACDLHEVSQAAYKKGKEDEREEIATYFEECGESGFWPNEIIAVAIRSRANKEAKHELGGRG